MGWLLGWVGGCVHHSMGCLGERTHAQTPAPNPPCCLPYRRPPGRTRPFSEPLQLDVCGLPATLFTIAGACLGTELHLASDSIPFGPVVLGSTAVKRVRAGRFMPPWIARQEPAVEMVQPPRR